MSHILDIAREQMMQPAPTPLPTPTEKSQIVIHYGTPHPSLVCRFNSVKKGEKEYAKLRKAWDKWQVVKFGGPAKEYSGRLHDIDGDMFITTVDLAAMASINFVDHAKQAKFIPV